MRTQDRDRRVSQAVLYPRSLTRQRIISISSPLQPSRVDPSPTPGGTRAFQDISEAQIETEGRSEKGTGRG